MKINKDNFIEAINTSGLSDQTKLRLNEINKIKDYFNSKIQERKIISKKLSKYIAALDYNCFIFNKYRSIYFFFCQIYWSFEGISSLIFSLAFSLTTRIIKNILQITRNKKKKHNKFVGRAKSKLKLNNSNSNISSITRP